MFLFTYCSLLLQENKHNRIFQWKTAGFRIFWESENGIALLLTSNYNSLSMQTVVLKVGMSCEGCVGAVKRVLGKMEGLSFLVE